jgi:hypothetical protein
VRQPHLLPALHPGGPSKGSELMDWSAPCVTSGDSALKHEGRWVKCVPGQHGGFHPCAPAWPEAEKARQAISAPHVHRSVGLWATREPRG